MVFFPSSNTAFADDRESECSPFTINPTDFNLDFYTEVQDLSYLETALSSASSRYSALNMAICELIEDFGLVGFETLAVEVSLRNSSVRAPYPILSHPSNHERFFFSSLLTAHLSMIHVYRTSTRC